MTQVILFLLLKVLLLPIYPSQQQSKRHVLRPTALRSKLILIQESSITAPSVSYLVLCFIWFLVSLKSLWSFLIIISAFGHSMQRSVREYSLAFTPLPPFSILHSPFMQTSIFHTAVTTTKPNPTFECSRTIQYHFSSLA